MGAALDRLAERARSDHDLEDRLARARLRVWIDQDLCTGDGICEDLSPAVFVILEDGIAYVHEGDRVFNDPGQSAGLARVTPEEEAAVVSAAEDCPGECIFIESAGSADTELRA